MREGSRTPTCGSRSRARTSWPRRSARARRPDVFAAANTKLPDALAAEGSLEQPVVFASNRLVLAVPADGAKVESLEDLERPGVTIVIGAEGVPVGDYTREVLDAARPGAQRGDPRQRPLGRARRQGHRRQAHAGRGRRRLRLRDRRRGGGRRAAGDRAARRTCEPPATYGAGGGQGQPSSPRPPRRSSTACSRAGCHEALLDARASASREPQAAGSPRSCWRSRSPSRSPS